MEKRKKSWKRAVGSLTVFIVIMLVVNVFIIAGMTDKAIREASETYTYSEFIEKAKAGEITQVIIPASANEDIKIIMKNDKLAFTSNPDSAQLRTQLVEMNVNVISEEKSSGGGFFQQIIIGVIVLSIVFFLFRLFSGRKNIPSSPLKKDETKGLTDSKNHRHAKFADVSVDETVQESLWEVIEYLKDPAKFTKVGAKPSSGVLLYGPPGTGKTLLARAVAGEAGVPFYAVSGGSFGEMYVGVGASRVREIFEEARKNAPAIIFIDEIDVVGAKRNNSTNSDNVQTITQLLTEMDGMKKNDGIVVIATTNRKESLDEAILRAGRFSKHIEIENPDEEQREAILKVHSRNKKLEKGFDLTRLANMTKGFSGADLEFLMNESALFALRRKSEEISWEDSQDAFELHLLGPKKKKNQWSEFENKVVAYHEVGHALASVLIAGETFERITVNPAGAAGGYVLRSSKNRKLSTKKELFNDICISMGGRVAETIIFGEENVTTGAQQDFRQASNTALNMVFVYGMSDIGVIAVPRLDESMWSTLSPEVRNQAQVEMSKILKEAETVVKEMLIKNKDHFEALTKKIMEVKTMDGRDFVKHLEALQKGEVIEGTGFQFLDNHKKEKEAEKEPLKRPGIVLAPSLIKEENK